MAALAQVCLHHRDRPAVARCPSCGESYCRECVVEHDFRLICASCLAKLSQAKKKAGRSWLPAAPVLQAAAGLMLSWWFFSWVCGRLHDDPAAVHKGFKWSTNETVPSPSDPDGTDPSK